MVKIAEPSSDTASQNRFRICVVNPKCNEKPLHKAAVKREKTVEREAENGFLRFEEEVAGRW